MDFLPSTEQVCYARCNFCNTVLAVGVPSKRLLDTVTVKCGHCSNLSFLSARPLVQRECMNNQTGLQSVSSESRKGHQASSSSMSSSTSNNQIPPKVHTVVKPPEKKHRLPSAYNRFMKGEIQRIKAGNPEIPHREAFSMASKNWARFDPQLPNGLPSENNKVVNYCQQNEENSVTIMGDAAEA